MAAMTVEGALDGASKTIQGAVRGAVPGLFGVIAGQVAAVRLNEAKQTAVGRLHEKLGGDGVAILNQVIGGNVSGAVDSAINKAISRVTGHVTAPESNTGSIAGKVSSGNDRRTVTVSAWGGLSRHLIASIYPVDHAGVALATDDVVSVIPVRGAVSDVAFDASFNWQSPFENVGPESKAPALMALIQSGQLGVVANALQQVLPKDASGTQSLLAQAQTAAKELEGRTGITKLNSRQVFSGMPPVKITMTLHLRAVTDAVSEVVDPYQRLLEWAFPRELAENGVFTQLLTTSNGLIKSLFPSSAPTLVGFTFGNNRYGPMVIESVGNPLDGPMDRNGRPIYRAVQVTLATLTALDKYDVAKIFTR